MNGMDVARVRQLVSKLAVAHGFSSLKQTKFVTATSEIARNAVKYGHGGTMQWMFVKFGHQFGIRVVIADQGPGITDTGLALSDGWSSGGGLGLGLPGAKRLVDEFVLESTPGVGTRVTITMWK